MTFLSETQGMNLTLLLCKITINNRFYYNDVKNNGIFYVI